MEFCPNCGMHLSLIQTTLNDQVNFLFSCPKCTYQRSAATEESFLRVSELPTTEKVAVIDDESANLHTMPTTKVECPKCNNKEAFWWMVQTRGADESPTQFFRCTKCSYTWREMA
jgi:DNA-directed RNA polymerase subunit M